MLSAVLGQRQCFGHGWLVRVRADVRSRWVPATCTTAVQEAPTAAVHTGTEDVGALGAYTQT
jgi:hypothetical protein